MASKRHLRRKSCDGKKKYPNSAIASNAAFARGRISKSWIIPYRCKFCGGYHIGHPPKHVRQSILAKRGFIKSK